MPARRVAAQPGNSTKRRRDEELEQHAPEEPSSKEARLLSENDALMDDSFPRSKAGKLNMQMALRRLQMKWASHTKIIIIDEDGYIKRFKFKSSKVKFDKIVKMAPSGFEVWFKGAKGPAFSKRVFREFSEKLLRLEESKEDEDESIRLRHSFIHNCVALSLIEAQSLVFSIGFKQVLEFMSNEFPITL